MRAEPWGLVRTDHGSSMIRCTPNLYITQTFICTKDTCTFTVLSMDIFLSVYFYLSYMLSLFALLSVCTVLFLYWKLLTPRQIPCVQTHLAIQLFLILILSDTCCKVSEMTSAYLCRIYTRKSNGRDKNIHENVN